MQKEVCRDVPKEVCHLGLANPHKVKRPMQLKWCTKKGEGDDNTPNGGGFKTEVDASLLEDTRPDRSFTVKCTVTYIVTELCTWLRFSFVKF